MLGALVRRVQAVRPETWAAWFVLIVCGLVLLAVAMMIGSVIMYWVGF